MARKYLGQLLWTVEYQFRRTRMFDEDEEEGRKASDFLAIVMVDEEAGNKYMRMVLCKGLGENGEAKWVISNLHEELKDWGITP